MTVRGYVTERPPRSIAVLRALKLGDLLCAVPALRALRAAAPSAAITLVGLPWAAEFADRFRHLIDRFVAFPGWPGLPEREPDLAAAVPFLCEMRAARFDLAVQLHGSGPVVNPVVAEWRAARTAGFYLPGGDSPPDPELFVPWPEHGLEVGRLLRLTDHLGCAPRGEHLEFPVTADDEAELRAVAGELRPGGYAVVHPGASVPGRRWPVDRFAAVAERLVARGLRVVVTGTAGEAPLAAAIAEWVPAVDLTGQTGLGATAAAIRSARLLVCNDTGVSHVAAGVGCSSVVLSTGDNPARWAPADRRRHRVLCEPDGTVAVADVLAEVDALLGESPAPAGAGLSPPSPREESCDRSAC